MIIKATDTHLNWYFKPCLPSGVLLLNDLAPFFGG